MNKLSYYLTFFSLVFLISCGETEEIVPEIVFTNSTLSSGVSFVENKVSLIVEGSGFSEVQVRASESSVVIEELADNLFEISTNAAVSSAIYVTLKNDFGGYSETQTHSITFVEHGVKDFTTVEGVHIDRHKRDRVIQLLGEPDYIELINLGAFEGLFYMDLGLIFTIDIGSQFVTAVNVYGYSWSKSVSENEYRTVKKYPYSIGDLGMFTSLEGILMDAVVEKMGLPAMNRKYVSSNVLSTRKWYVYDAYSDLVAAIFYFNSDDVDAYQGEKLTHLRIQ